ncbi:hypothetical protein, partial [Collinsella sp. TM09-10AT]|uniref:hypothetical protein n=1 Tax=Collinsella sp. TM09-10AT TaxID=2292343 RepID=UPI001F230302
QQGLSMFLCPAHIVSAGTLIPWGRRKRDHYFAPNTREWSIDESTFVHMARMTAVSFMFPLAVAA